MKDFEAATKVAWSLHGTPYIWGGDDPEGFDCSGLVVEILKSSDVIPRGSDFTAQQLYDLFAKKKLDRPYEGCLVFWGKNTEHITHVEYCLDNIRTMGASGGGSRTRTVKDAYAQNAYVKVRPIRPGYVAIVDPYE